tara:strand:- start:1658 stop:2728 length:1071 start_codon:yes stop_codon:yes gene_type:complete
MSFEIKNSFGVAGVSRYLHEIENVENVEFILRDFNASEFKILGGGYNSIPQEFFDGSYIHITDSSILVEDHGEYIDLIASAGAKWDDLVALSIKCGGKGLENLSLIPGSVGASPIHNIGAYGREVSEFIEKVHCYDLSTRSISILDRNECEFDYRNSIFKTKDRLLITKVVYRVKKRKFKDYIKSLGAGDLLSLIKYSFAALSFFEKGRFLKVSFDQVRDILKLEILPPVLKRIVVIAIRKRILLDPSVVGNSGCFFKCPIIQKLDFEKICEKYPDIEFHMHNGLYKISACWLLRKTGWAGKEYGGVMPDAHKPVMLLNRGSATAETVRDAVSIMQKDVFYTFGICIYPEVVLVSG